MSPNERIRAGPLNKVLTIKVLTAIAALCALGVSVRSYYISERAEQTAREALETTQRQVLVLNRPHIILSPKKYVKTDSYFKISRLTDGVAEVNFQLEMRNVGNIIAKDVVTPTRVALREKILGRMSTLSFHPPPKATLGPGDSQVLLSSLVVGGKDDESARRFISELKADQRGITFLIPVQYRSQLNPRRSYRTLMEYRLKRNSVQILKSEMTMTSREPSR